MVGHNQTPAGKATGTLCPGGFNYQWVLDRAIQINSPEPTPDPDPVLDPRLVQIRTAWDSYKAELAEIEPSFAALDELIEALK
jgi:hypothetical protein